MSQEYLVFRICERFSIVPREFKKLTRREQVQLLAFEQIRQTEETKMEELHIQAATSAGIKKSL